MGHAGLLVTLGALAALAALPPGAASAEEPGRKPPPAAAAKPADEDPPLPPEEQKKLDEEVKTIVAELRAERNKDRMQARIDQLGSRGGRAARDALMLFARGNKNQEFVEAAFRGLSMIGGTKVVDFLCAADALGAYNNFLVQIAAAGALGETGNARATQPLLDTMLHPRTKIEVASACCKAVVKVNPREPKVAAGVLQLSRAKDDTVRANAVEAVGKLGSDEAYRRLLEALQKDSNSRVRGAAAAGLRDLGRKEAIPALQKAVEEDKADSVRSLAMEAIRALGGVSK